MDEGMKNNVIVALMVGCLALGLMGQFGGTWLTDSDADDEGLGPMGITINSEYGLHDVKITLTGDNDTLVEMAEAGAESKDKDWATVNFADAFEGCTDDLKDARAMMIGMGMTDEQVDDNTDFQNSTDDCADAGMMADAGSYGGTTLWIGSVVAIVCVLVLVLGMAGVEIEQIPEKVPMITMWAAGALTGLAVLLWYMTLPSSGDASAGMSVYLTVLAAVCGLAAGGMTTFMPDEAAPAAAEEAPAAE
jgi:hypothetical protein